MFVVSTGPLLVKYLGNEPTPFEKGEYEVLQRLPSVAQVELATLLSVLLFLSRLLVFELSIFEACEET